MFLLDTDHIVFLQRGTGTEYARLKSRMAVHAAADFNLTIVSFHEQFLGWNAYIHRARTVAGVVRGYSMLGNALRDFTYVQVVPFDEQAAKEFESLKRQRVRIGTMDLRIAAIALVNGHTVLSRNLVDFQKVPGLVVEDWTKP